MTPLAAQEGLMGICPPQSSAAAAASAAGGQEQLLLGPWEELRSRCVCCRGEAAPTQAGHGCAAITACASFGPHP
jgi:hypothetical protein